MTAPLPPVAPKRRRLITWGRAAIGTLWLLSLAVAAQAGVFVFENKTAILRRLGRIETTGVLSTNLYARRLPASPDPHRRPLRCHRAPRGRRALLEPQRPAVVRRLHASRCTSSRCGCRSTWTSSSRPVQRQHGRQGPFRGQGPPRAGDAGRRAAVRQPQPVGRREGLLRAPRLGHRPAARGVSSAGRTARGGPSSTRAPAWSSDCAATADRVPTIGAGGRIVPLSEHEILVSVGIFINDAQVTDDPEMMLRPDEDYGKTIAIDLRTGAARPFTTRAPQPAGPRRPRLEHLAHRACRPRRGRAQPAQGRGGTTGSRTSRTAPPMARWTGR
jgi:hypothetical protein